jgi:hypothetical protein
VRFGLPAESLALVALETSLLDKLLCFAAEIPVIPIRKLPLLRVVNWMPLGADVGVTSQADLAAWAQSSR